MKHRSVQCLSALGAASLLVAAAPLARASSFSLFGDQSVASSGLAGAGGAATAYDASTIFYNPAGMSFLESKLTVTTGVSWIVPSIQFSNNGSVTAPGSRLQQPTTGGNTGPIGSNNAGFFNSSVPQFYVAYKFNDRFSAGLGINAPFGLETDYNETSVLRYNATNSRITNINFNPSLSYKILPNLSIGAGANIAYTQVGLSSAVDFGLVNASTVGAISVGPLASFVPTIVGALGGPSRVAPQLSDGFARFSGDSVGIGWNVGLLYEPIPGTKLGVSYRSNIHNDITGHTRFVNVPLYANVPGAVAASGLPGAAGAAAALTPTFNGLAARFVTNRPISAGLNLPNTASGSFSQKVGNNFNLLGDVTWTRWSTIQTVQIFYTDNIAASPSPLAFNYKNTFRYSLGGTYQAGPALFRLGFAYDNTPVESRTTRTPRLPDSDRITIGAGLSYRATKTISVDLAYNHLFFQASDTNTSDNAGHVLIGTFHTHADVFSFGTTLWWGAPKQVMRPEPKMVATK